MESNEGDLATEIEIAESHSAGEMMVVCKMAGRIDIVPAPAAGTWNEFLILTHVTLLFCMID